jgi:hypothetical protein
LTLLIVASSKNFLTPPRSRQSEIKSLTKSAKPP